MNTPNPLRLLLTDDRWNLSADEIAALLDEELSKPAAEQEPAFIEYCLAALEQTQRTNDRKKTAIRRFHPSRKTLVAAAVVVLLLVSSLTVSAVSGLLPTDGIVEFYETHIRIRFEPINEPAEKYALSYFELAAELAAHGIAPVMLPEALLSENYKITSIEYGSTVAAQTAIIRFKWKRKKGSFIIRQKDDAEKPDAYVSVSEFPDAKRLETITISGVTVYVMEQNEQGHIAFAEGTRRYTILVPLPFEETIEFAKTIK